jgi:hypothetical protein
MAVLSLVCVRHRRTERWRHAPIGAGYIQDDPRHGYFGAVGTTETRINLNFSSWASRSIFKFLADQKPVPLVCFPTSQDRPTFHKCVNWQARRSWPLCDRMI